MSAPNLCLAELLRGFFYDRLITQRNATERTVASYRDAFRIFLRFAEERLGKIPTALAIEDVDAPLVLAFLNHLERQRGNSVRSRNARLAALRSFLTYASHLVPHELPSIRRVLAIPLKRFDRTIVANLSREEVQAILDATDASTRSGRRDRALFETLYNTGARVSEIVGLAVGDLDLSGAGALRIRGKGRKQRTVPLWKGTKVRLRAWCKESAKDDHGPLFPNRNGSHLTRSGVAARLRIAVAKARGQCDSLRARRISPHVIRHTTAMHLLQSGVDLSVIALWLGHERPDTTHKYLEADLATKRRALDRLQPPRSRRSRAPVGDPLLRFLDGL